MAKRERFSLPPRSVGIPHSTPRLSMMDRQIAALRAEQEREKNRIKTREELFNDLTNFALVPEVDEYGLPFRTPYQVPDNVPDMLPLPEKNTAEEKKQNSVKPEDSPNPQGGAE